MEAIREKEIRFDLMDIDKGRFVGCTRGERSEVFLSQGSRFTTYGSVINPFDANDVSKMETSYFYHHPVVTREDSIQY